METKLLNVHFEVIVFVMSQSLYINLSHTILTLPINTELRKFQADCY